MSSTAANSEALAAEYRRPSWAAFLVLGFRPLYIAGAAWALISIALWIFAPQWLVQPLGGVVWHAHEMLWGVIITIAVGFLLTASATWTGINPISGRPLGALCLLWVVARLGYLFGGWPGLWVAGAAEVAFLLWAAGAILRVVLKSNSRRNLGLPVLLAVLAAADVLFLVAAANHNYMMFIERFDLGLIGMAVIALLIARRVVPFFAMRMVQGLDIPRLTRSGHVQMVFGGLALACGLLGWMPVAAALLAATGLISLGQLLFWKPWRVLDNPMLWILYLGYFFIGLGLIVAGVQLGGVVPATTWGGVFARPATYVHVIGLAGFCILIIGMLHRTALGHLGRPLALDGRMLTGHWLMVLAVLLRLAALWPTAQTQTLLHLAGAVWVVCMALYLWCFVPLLIRPRPDRPLPGRKPAATQAAKA